MFIVGFNIIGFPMRFGWRMRSMVLFLLLRKVNRHVKVEESK